MKGVSELGMGLTSVEISAMFAYFDQDRSGFVNYEEFLSTLRVSGC